LRDETRKAIEGKVNYWLAYKDKSGKTSAEHAVEALLEIGVNDITEDVLKAYVYSAFAAICYDVTALIEARGHPRRGTTTLERVLRK